MHIPHVARSNRSPADDQAAGPSHPPAEPAVPEDAVSTLERAPRADTVLTPLMLE